MTVLYTSPGCGPCIVMKRWLAAHSVTYQEVNARESPPPEHLEIKGTPALVHEGVVIRGFDLDKLKAAFA
jgi:glutaredoxin